MNEGLSNLARQYAMTLRKFTAREREEVLAQAYGLGRAAIANGFGVLDMARVHQASLDELLWRPLPPDKHGRTLCTAGNFFLETLAPFEVTHRGFQETNTRLQRTLLALEKRNGELAVSNQQLTREIRHRKKTERALRVSKEHFRKLFQEARAMQKNLRDLSDKILHAQEEERKRISRELHDETSQALAMISITLASLHAPGLTPDRMRARIQETQVVLQETMESLHDFAVELRPASIDELGLLPALRSWLKTYARRTGLQVAFRATPEVEELDEDKKMTLYRVVQESLSNVAKHARASHVDFVIRRQKDRVCAVISNDGKSFNPAGQQAARRKQRIGLLGMQERVRLVGGTLVIKPRPGNGTVLRVSIPLSSKKISAPLSTGSRQKSKLRFTFNSL